jgi:hypothetical protein
MTIRSQYHLSWTSFLLKPRFDLTDALDAESF